MALTNEFTRFKQWLHGRKPTDAVLMVEANMSAITQTTHAGGQRTRVICRLPVNLLQT